MEREITLGKALLNIPVTTGAPKQVLRLLVDGALVREMEVELAPAEADFWVYLHVGEFQGRKAILRSVEEIPEEQSAGFEAIHQDDTFPGQDGLYSEALRPQLHFSSKRGWNNDPNGLVYYRGEYHLFYQHNPFGWPWGNMTWGHATSKDLVHWEELADALHPDEMGTMFSGSAVVDVDNTAGFQTGEEHPIVCIYTAAGDTNRWSEGVAFTQCLAYSNDRGRTWTKYDGNPVVQHINGGNRDPKVIRHAPSGEWAMVLYLDDNRMGVFTSPDLKTWEKRSELECFHECPELFQLPVDGDGGNLQWVLYGAHGRYFVGDFDGTRFTPATQALEYNRGNCFYASQTFSDIPEEDGRRIQIGWGQVELPGMAFNQMMTFPVTLTLRTTRDGVRMCAEPVREIDNLRTGKRWNIEGDVDVVNEVLGREVKGRLFDVDAEIAVGDATEIVLLVNGVALTYDVAGESLTVDDNQAALRAQDGKVRLRLVVDTVSIEIFGNDGEVYMPMGAVRDAADETLAVRAAGEGATVSLEIHELRSIWP